jgi:HPt (histidine-containing phosphotransfer) domain-containing protein
MPGDRERCLAVGMDDYLSKPVRGEELDAVLARWVTPPVASLVDDAHVRLLREEVGELASELADSFAQRGPRLVAELRGAVERQDPAATRFAAHALRGSALNMGATALATLAGAIEYGEAEPTAAVTEIETLLAPTTAAIRALAAAPGSS